MLSFSIAVAYFAIVDKLRKFGYNLFCPKLWQGGLLENSYNCVGTQYHNIT